MPPGLNRPVSDIESIVGIQFGIFSPDEIQRRSVVEITNSGTYDGNEPRIGGLFDPRMGVLDNGKTCRSCAQTNHSCPGHFGHLNLARPVYFIQFFPKIIDVMKCICVRCSRILIDKTLHKDIARRRGEGRWRAVLTRSATISRCGQETEDGCGARQPDRYAREGIARIVAEWDEIDGPGGSTIPAESKSGKQRQYLEVEYVLRLFRRITDEDVDFMGLNRYWCRPDWMICTTLPIPPPQVRPSVIQDNNQRSEDDLTHKLFEIIMTNQRLQDKITNNAPKHLIEDEHVVLQYHVATLVDNQIPGVAPSAQRSGRPLKSVQQRLGSKEGRIRYNIQGKRVEFSARSVITPDPNISIGELGVPMKIAMNLTFPEKVTPYNIKQMYKLVQNGSDKYPGAKTLVRGDGRMISLKHINTKEIVLRVGDVINRHLADGDIILFNRQPTLHRMSMMGHRVRVLPYNTFRLNVSVTAPYNADFDGDEMNAHGPQSYESATELAEIAAVPHQIVTPRHAKPVIGIVQDTLVGSYRITRPHVGFNRREFMNMMMWNRRFEGVVPQPTKELAGQFRFSGQQILSQLLPPINLEMGNGMYKDDKKQENFVKIREGNILQGIFDKDIFSKPSKGIIHVAFKDYGPTDTVNFIDSMQNTIEQFLVYNGFSVGVSDLIADEETRKNMEDVVQKRKAAIENILLQIHMDLFDNNTGKSNRQEFEDKVFTELNKATEEAGKIGLGSLSDENRLVAMVRAGSKGSNINIAQMMACVGQQAPEGKRIPYGFTDRTLPHYKKYDDGAEARGFVESSFIQGLTPQEFFFHAMSGREGLIDTAVKTADTGYIQRQLVKAMEDLVVQYDGTVRDSRMNITQFYYGEDGINATKIESANLGLVKISQEEIIQQYGMKTADVAAVLDPTAMRGEDEEALDAFSKQILEDQRMLVENIQRFKQDAPIFSSVNLDRLITNVAVSFRLSQDTKTDLTPLYVLQGIERLIQRTQSHHKLWAALLRFTLAPHKLIIKERFTKKAFDTICEMIIVKNMQSWVVPGEQVGIIAAQSIGEPSTQMTLNSVDWDTKIMIAKNGKIICPMIGDFIDSYLATADPEDIKYLENDQIYIALDDGNDWKAVSCDENGTMMWTKLEAITSHPVINEDGSNTILEVTLASGRKVKATKGKSFLTLIDNKVQDINGSELCVGDVLPIANSLAIDAIETVKTVSVREHLHPKDWLYGSDVQIALAHLNSGEQHWFQKNNGSVFTVPYSRSDSFREAFVDGKNTNASEINSGFVYPARTRPNVSQIPEEISLTEPFGFFVGAYLAEGMSNATQINITNNDMVYLNKVNTLMTEWNVGTHMVSAEREAIKTGIKGHSSSLVIHSTVLASFMQKAFGRVSYEKTMPDWVFQAPRSFVNGLVDGYFSGDGTVEKKTGCVKATSVSKELITRFGTLLASFGIFSTVSERLPEIGLFDSVRVNYTLYVPVKYSNVFANTFELTMESKQTILNEHFPTEHKCNRGITGDVVWDTIKSIVEVEPINNRVYDLTVETTRNFTTMDCIALKDTFHLAGVASKSNVTRGVPRLKELLKVTQNPKATSLTIYLKPEFRGSKDKARQVAQDLELTLLRDITVKTAIYYDPTNEETVVQEDNELIKFYNLFEADEEPVDGEVTKWSAWLLRFEMDRERMFRKNISMDDVAYVLRTKFGESLHLIYSDYNSNKLIMRMRLPDEMKGSLDDMTSLKKFQNRILNGIVFRGVPGIKSITFREDKEMLEMVDGSYKQVTQYILDTDGSNYLQVMNHPYVNASKLSSSHVHDIFDVLGIEATRALLLNEITALFEEAGVNNRHLGLLCDVMTRAGRLMSSDRHGINKTDIGPIAKASFEETEKILLNAALFGEMDPITGVSANIMTGQPIRGGTSFFDMLLDEGAFLRLQEGLPPLEGYDEEDENDGPTQEQIDEAIYEDDSDLCSSAHLRMNIAMPNGNKILEEPDIEIDVIDSKDED